MIFEVVSLNRKKFFVLIWLWILILVLFRVLIVRVLLSVNFMFLVLDVFFFVVEICLDRFVVGISIFVIVML